MGRTILPRPSAPPGLKKPKFPSDRIEGRRRIIPAVPKEDLYFEEVPEPGNSDKYFLAIVIILIIYLINQHG